MIGALDVARDRVAARIAQDIGHGPPFSARELDRALERLEGSELEAGLVLRSHLSADGAKCWALEPAGGG